MSVAVKVVCEKSGLSKHTTAATSMRDEAGVLEAIIFSNLQKEDLPLPSLLDRLAQRGVQDEAKLRATITQLLAEDKLELTRLRRIRIPLEAANQYKTEEESKTSGSQQKPKVKAATAA